MNTETDTQYVLITGGASGLGAALARIYRNRGAEVCTVDVNPGADDEPLDVRDSAAWEALRDRLAERWPRVDVLFNCAGVASGGRIDLETLDEWQRVLDINLMGTVRGVQTFVPVMKEQRSGQIINIASLAGLAHPSGMSAYNASKAGVVALTESIGHELAPFGIRAAVVCPSFFRSDLSASLAGVDQELNSVAKHLIDDAPLSADDIARVVVAAVDEGEDDVILPDQMARDVVALKASDRTTYNAVMRSPARKMAEK